MNEWVAFIIALECILSGHDNYKNYAELIVFYNVKVYIYIYLFICLQFKYIYYIIRVVSFDLLVLKNAIKKIQLIVKKRKKLQRLLQVHLKFNL